MEAKPSNESLLEVEVSVPQVDKVDVDLDVDDVIADLFAYTPSPKKKPKQFEDSSKKDVKLSEKSTTVWCKSS